MEWAFKWEEALQSGIYYGRLLPEGYISPEDQEPILGPLAFYLDAFRELCSSRPSGLSETAIPFTAIVEYSTIYELDDVEEFVELMRLMDNAFLRLSSARNKNKGTNATSNRS